MTADEVKAVLEDIKIPAGSWQETPEKTIISPIATTQVEALMKLKGILETLIKDDSQNVAKLREQLVRLQFGGGS